MKPPRQKTKVLVRKLPPAMSEDTFKSVLDSVAAGRYNWLSYYAGKVSLKRVASSRAYINFVSEEDVYNFKQRFDGHVFISRQGNQYRCAVEYAPLQKMPTLEAKPHPLEGTIDQGGGGKGRREQSGRQGKGQQAPAGAEAEAATAGRGKASGKNGKAAAAAAAAAAAVSLEEAGHEAHEPRERGAGRHGKGREREPRGAPAAAAADADATAAGPSSSSRGERGAKGERSGKGARNAKAAAVASLLGDDEGPAPSQQQPLVVRPQPTAAPKLLLMKGGARTTQVAAQPADAEAGPAVTAAEKPGRKEPRGHRQDSGAAQEPMYGTHKTVPACRLTRLHLYRALSSPYLFAFARGSCSTAYKTSCRRFSAHKP
eukprot:XP_001691099.1 UPF3 protein [Chlamydomonas reinhardtii]